MAAPPPVIPQVHLPRILALIASLAVLSWVNRHTRNQVLPAVLGLVVLYVALTNLERAQELVGMTTTSLGNLIHPSTPAPAAGGGGGARKR